MFSGSLAIHSSTSLENNSISLIANIKFFWGEAEIRKFTVQGQPGQIVHETPPISKMTRAKWT
jgi:hypothetical protein